MMAEQVRLYYSVERKMTFLRGDTPLNVILPPDPPYPPPSFFLNLFISRFRAIFPILLRLTTRMLTNSC